MQVITKTMGKVYVENDDIIKIPSGLFGFEEYTNFALIKSEEYHPFVCLQSLDDEKLAFWLIDPFLICDDYEADIDDMELARISIKDPSDVVVMTIVTIPSDGGPLTANFQGPLIINKQNNQCMQAILDNTKWTTKHNIVEAIKKREGK